MTAITFDTLSVANRLKAKGIPSEQAEAIASELQTADTHLVTREYLDTRFELVNSHLEALELRIMVRLGGMIIGLGGILIAIKYFG